MKQVKNFDQKITILGDGAWGTAIATLLAHNGYRVVIWCYNAEVATTINEQHENKRFLPGVRLNARISATGNLNEALNQAAWIFEAIPVSFLRPVIKQAKAQVQVDQKWVILSKGMEEDTLALPSQIIDQELGYDVPKVVLAGPSFAAELASEQLTAVTLVSHPEPVEGSSNFSLTRSLQEILRNDYFKPCVGTDLLGIQVCAALKNVIAFGVGFFEGAGYKENARAFFITRALHEVSQCVVALGGNHDTILDLAGIGDTLLTAMSGQSRNVQAGRFFGQGMSLEEVMGKMDGKVPESINTLKSVKKLSEKYAVEMPLLNGLYGLVYEGVSRDDFIKKLI